MVNFVCQLDLATGYPRVWLNVISGLSMRVFLKNVSIWIHGLSKADGPSSWGGGASSSPLRASTEQGRQRKVETNLNLTAELRHWSPALGTPGSQAFTLRGECTPWLSRFYNFQLHSGFPGSPTCRWQIVGPLSLHNYVSQYLITL